MLDGHIALQINLLNLSPTAIWGITLTLTHKKEIITVILLTIKNECITLPVYFLKRSIVKIDSELEIRDMTYIEGPISDVNNNFKCIYYEYL